MFVSCDAIFTGYPGRTCFVPKISIKFRFLDDIKPVIHYKISQNHFPSKGIEIHTNEEDREYSLTKSFFTHHRSLGPVWKETGHSRINFKIYLLFFLFSSNFNFEILSFHSHTYEMFIFTMRPPVYVDIYVEHSPVAFQCLM